MIASSALAGFGPACPAATKRLPSQGFAVAPDAKPGHLADESGGMASFTRWAEA
jgi:hypothetical protein